MKISFLVQSLIVLSKLSLSKHVSDIYLSSNEGIDSINKNIIDQSELITLGEIDLSKLIVKEDIEDNYTAPEDDNSEISTVLKKRETDDNEDEDEGDAGRAKDGENDGRVKTSIFTFRGKVADYIYLEKKQEDSSDDETLIVLTDQREVFLSNDQGSSWEEVGPEEEYSAIYLNKFNTDDVFLTGVNDKIVYSHNRGKSWKFFRTPAPPIPGVKPLYFHPRRPNYLIFIGQEGCENQFSKACRTVAFVSRSYGKRWLRIQEHVASCQFIGGLQKVADPNYIVCQKEANEATGFNSRLIGSQDDFKDDKHVMLENVLGLVQVGDYLVCATVLENDELRAHVSIDGYRWADALFPPNLHFVKQQAYTTLSALTKSIFLHVTTNPRQGGEYGSILKSNSNGTSYVLSLNNVNRDSVGYVDFEQMSGLEGVIVVNTVSNYGEVTKGARKVLKSMITYNDGSQWSHIIPPSIDSEGKKYACTGKSTDKCSLNLHGYTEREDYRDTFSSQSAIGMMIGIGNVGEKLENYWDGNTFLTKDGGVTWKEVKKGVYMWEYGDQGSVIVLVNAKDMTNTLLYSLDEGDTWSEYKFTDELVTVQDISTVPSDNSLRFLLFTRVPLARGDKTRLFQIDFSQLLNTPCRMDLTNPDTDDFELWTPKHPFQSDNCLFGHETQYYRKVPGKTCHIGKKLTQPHKVVRNCACTRQDYECDFNYFLDVDGICKLVPGYNPPDHKEVCFSENPPTEYWFPTGYRKIPLSSCEGGHEFDKVTPIACPGKENEFIRKYPGLGIFTIVLLSIIGLGAIAFFGSFLYNYYYAKFGEIRLGEDANINIVDAGFGAQLNQYAGETFIAVVALASQGIKIVTLKLKDLQTLLRERITGGNSRYSNASPYVVSDEDDNETNDIQEDRLGGSEHNDITDNDSSSPYRDGDLGNGSDNRNFNLSDDE